MAEILQRNEPVLRKVAKPVPADVIGTPKLSKILSDMKKAMDAQADGIAIAAPQIGESYRIFLISGSLLKQADPTYKGDGTDLIFINPKITKLSREKESVEEGCLSVRWLYGHVKRAVKVTLEALNEKGEKISRGASGLLAQIFQHETDHLDGKLFIDSAEAVWEMSEEEIKDLQKRSK